MITVTKARSLENTKVLRVYETDVTVIFNPLLPLSTNFLAKSESANQ